MSHFLLSLSSITYLKTLFISGMKENECSICSRKIYKSMYRHNISINHTQFLVSKYVSKNKFSFTVCFNILNIPPLHHYYPITALLNKHKPFCKFIRTSACRSSISNWSHPIFCIREINKKILIISEWLLAFLYNGSILDLQIFQI